VQAQVRRYEQECGPVTTTQLIEWCEPALVAVTTLDEPMAHVGKQEVTLNRVAVEFLGVPERVKIGAMLRRDLILEPTNRLSGFKLTLERRPNKGIRAAAASLGKKKLVNWLLGKGIERGYYRLERDEKLGVFVGRRLAP